MSGEQIGGTGIKAVVVWSGRLPRPVGAQVVESFRVVSVDFYNFKAETLNRESGSWQDVAELARGALESGDEEGAMAYSLLLNTCIAQALGMLSVKAGLR